MTLLTKENKLSGLLATKPKAVQANEQTLEFTPLFQDKNYPLLLKSTGENILLTEWVKNNRQLIADRLKSSGAILFRNFNLNSVNSFQQVVQVFSEETMKYTQRSSPRTEITDNIYTSTDHPADQSINMHNELSYSPSWPLRIIFFCVTPSATGGETPIADSRKVLSHLSASTRLKFLEKGILYMRNLGGGLGLKWQEVFQTSDKAQVEEECRKNNMQFKWKNEEHLQISWVRPAIVDHPETGETIWFNHAYFFNSYNLDATVREVVHAEENFPFNTFYGDGTPIEESVIKEIGEAYEKSKAIFPWQKGDMLLLDNMLMSHGRNPYEGERKIAVAMWQPNN